MQITFVTRKFRNVERNLHCDVLFVAPLESPDSFWIAMAFSRFRPIAWHLMKAFAIRLLLDVAFILSIK